MIKRIINSPLLVRQLKAHPYPVSMIIATNMLRNSLYLTVSTAFSEGKHQPKNKYQAWRQQQQQKIKQEYNEDQLSKVSYQGVTKIGASIFIVLAGALIYFIYYARSKNEQNTDNLDIDISGLRQLKDKQSVIGGEWTLIGTEGQPVSSKNLSGYYYLIYFGYTNCPDVCPSTLYYLSSVYRIIRNLPEGAYMKLKIVFVSVDPERDPPKAMKQYLKEFGKQIIGVTSNAGYSAELQQCLRKFKIKSNKIPYESGVKKGQYEIDHTTRVYLMDSDNNYLDHLNPKLTEQQTAKLIVAKIVQNEHRKDKAERALKS